MNPKQWRPVALLPAGARLLERLVADQIIEFLEEEELLHSSNHGFRSKHGTNTAIAEAQGVIYEAIEEGKIVGMMTLDQSSAFDVVEHSILKIKLSVYRFEDEGINWLMSYLDGRSQYVALQTSRSETVPVGSIACPQGSCLGPLIWTLYAGEVPEVVAQNQTHTAEDEVTVGGRMEVQTKLGTGWIIQYANDIMVLLTRKTPAALKEAAETAYQILAPWFRRAKLQLNAVKTHWVYFATQQKKNCIYEIPLNLEGRRVKASKSEKVLGVTLEGNLSMREHISRGDESLMKRAKTKMRALWRVKNVLSFKARKETASGLVMSRILYGGAIWIASASKAELREAQAVENQLMRFVCGSDVYRQEDLLSQTGYLSIRQWGVYLVLMLGLGVEWEKTPHNLFKQLESSDNREPRLKTTTRTFRQQYQQLKVKIPPEFLGCRSKKLKKKLKCWIKEHVPPNIGTEENSISDWL